MDDLRERLALLADEAPRRDARDADELWGRGRAYGRRRRLAAGAATLLVVAGGVGVTAAFGLGLPGVPLEVAAPVPADAAVLPDRVPDPPAWMVGTDDVGLPGRLSAVRVGERGGWFGVQTALAGVSAADGSMAWLDLPADAVVQEAAVSPDGRHVAFWTTGETTGRPADQDLPQTVGVAVWDAASGEVTRHDFATEHGLMTARLAWFDADTLVLRAFQLRGGYDDPMGSSSGAPAPWLRWDPAEGEPTELEVPDDVAELGGVPGDGTLVVEDLRSGTTSITDLTGRPLSRPFETPAVDPAQIVASPRLELLAAVPGSSNPAALAVAQIPRRSDLATVFADVPGGERSFEVLRWLDDRTVVVARRPGAVGLRPRTAIVAQDVVTGSRERLTTTAGYGPSVSFAHDLLAADVVTAPELRTVTDPRRLAAGGAALLVAGVGVLWWRRRAQP